MRHRTAVVIALLLAACTSAAKQPVAPPPEPITEAEFAALLAESERPVVVNVWASWCAPCRSEAPLLSAASREFEDEVRFVMLDVRDSPSDGAVFVDEFYADAVMEHYGDRSGDIPAHIGGNRGVPLTFFFAPGGELANLHYGAIDERTVALQVDELLAR